MNDFIPYGRQSIDQNDIKAVTDVLKSDFLTQGPEIEKFEKDICRFTGAKYCLVTSSATAGLHMAVSSLAIPAKSEGITSPNTFVASANSLIYNSIKPIFADIDEKTYNIDAKQIEKKITKKTRVIVAVDYAGQVCEAQRIYKIAKSRGIFVVEDAAHAIGSRYASGERVGSCKYSDLTVFSFHPVKNMTTGEGGAVTTNSKKLYEKLLLLRSHGVTKNPSLFSKNPGPWYYEMQSLGFNYRMSDISAALGRSQLKRLPRFIKRRREIVKKYNEAFKKIENITIPFERPKVVSAFHLYTLKIDFDKIGKSRSQVMAELKIRGVGSQVLYIPVHLQPYYRKTYGYKIDDFPLAESYYKRALSLPLFPGMTDKDVEKVIRAVKEVVGD